MAKDEFVFNPFATVPASEHEAGRSGKLRGHNGAVSDKARMCSTVHYDSDYGTDGGSRGSHQDSKEFRKAEDSGKVATFSDNLHYVGPTVADPRSNQSYGSNKSEAERAKPRGEYHNPSSRSKRKEGR